MALYHFHVEQIKRSEGRTAVASAAYRAGEKLHNLWDGETHDYTRKGGVILTEIILPEHAPKRFYDRSTLWNEVEQIEKHYKAQLAYSFDMALQNEFSLEENIELAREFVQKYFVSDGMIVDLAIHKPNRDEGGIPNPHFHVLVPIRPLNDDGTWGAKQHRVYKLDEEGNRIKKENGQWEFDAVPTTNWGRPETLDLWRRAWADMVNARFEEKGLDCRIDHRSFVDQGLDLIPTVHEGPQVRKMEKKGIRTEKGELNRWIKATNCMIRSMRATIAALKEWIEEAKEILKEPQEVYLADLLRDSLRMRDTVAMTYARGRTKAKHNNTKRFMEECNYLRQQGVQTLSDFENYLSSVEEKLEEGKSSINQKQQRLKELQYLTEERKLPQDLIERFIADGLIYEDAKYHNAVFVGTDINGVPRYAHCRGITDKFRMDVTGSDKSFGFCYRGKGPELYVFEAPIDLLSHIALFPVGWEEHSYLSLGGVSPKALERFISERKDIESVFIATDRDDAGNNAAEKLLEVIPQEISVVRFLPEAKDWNEELINERNGISSGDCVTIGIRKPKNPQKSVPMLCMNDVEQTEVDWLWYPYIPFGKLTIVQGNPGEGKTFFAMQLAAACTNQKFLPDIEPFEPFNMIFQTAEDGLGDTVKPRLVSSGADLKRVLVIDDAENPLSLADDRIEKAIRENNAKLMVIDPLQAFLGANVDMNRANEVRPIFRKLADIAQSTGCSIVMIGHLNKASGTQSTYRGLGSIDIAAVVRSILFVGKVKDDPTTRVIVHEKSSLAPPGQALAFSLGDQKGFRWIGAYDISAEDLLAGGQGTKTELKQEQAVKLIYEFLSDGREASVAEINKEAMERGISERTVRLARNSMKDKLESERRGKDWWIWLKRQDETANAL